MTLSKAIEVFLHEQKARGNSLKTISSYKANLNRFYEFTGDIDVKSINKKTIMDFIIYLQEKPKNTGHTKKKVDNDIKISSVTVRSYTRDVKAFMNWLYFEELVDVCIFDKMKLPRAFKPVIRILSEYDIERIIQYCRCCGQYATRNELLVLLMLDCGLRATEVCTIELKNIDLKNGILIVKGKGNKERIVPIGHKTFEFMKKHLEKCKTKFLFEDRYGKPFNYNSLACIIKRIKSKTNIENLHAHLFRHTFATLYIVNGGDIKSLQAILGHTSLKMCENYLHLASSYSISQYKKYSVVDRLTTY